VQAPKSKTDTRGPKVANIDELCDTISEPKERHKISNMLLSQSLKCQGIRKKVLCFRTSQKVRG